MKSRIILIVLALVLAASSGANPTPERLAHDLAARAAFLADDPRRAEGERLARSVAALSRPVLTSAPRTFGYASVNTVELLREVSMFSNVILISPIAPNFSRLRRAAEERSMKIGLAWDGVVFDTSSRPFRLRADYRERLGAILAAHPELGGKTYFSLLDEPYWHGADAPDVERVVDLLTEALPIVPTVIILAWPTLDELTGPVPSDWVGFDLYHVADPVTDPMYQFYWNRMKELNPEKPIVIVADGHYGPAHSAAGLAASDLGAVLRNYERLFTTEPKARALGVFRWSDSTDLLGTRSLPDIVVREHIAIGSSLSGRCGVPPALSPTAGETVLWLHGCRFYARVAIEDPGRTDAVAGIGVQQTDQSGFFWFFDEGNVEVTLKVLDGRSLNGYFWVFSSDMTDVNYRLEVLDTETGHLWLHANDGGREPIARDTMAFPD